MTMMTMNVASIQQSRNAAGGLAKAWAVSLFPPVSFFFAALAAGIALLFLLGDRGCRAPAAVALTFTVAGFAAGFLGMYLITDRGWGFDGLALMCLPGLLASAGFGIAASMYTRRLAATSL